MLKVFLVEDESIVREGLRDNIPWDQYGFEFAGEASDGEMALPLIRRVQPDILITDIKMPFMDGLTISRLISKELPNTKIIIISGYDDFEYARHAIELHVDQYLLKPVTKVAMIRALEQTRQRIEEEQEQKSFLRRFHQETREYEYYSRRIFFEKVMEGALTLPEIYEQAAWLELSLDAPGYNIILFSLQPRASLTEYSEAVAVLEDELLRDFLSFPEYVLFRGSLLSYAILVKGAMNQLDDLSRRCVEQIRRRCSMTKMTVDWYVAIGMPIETLPELPGCYAKATHLLSFRHILPGQHVLTTEIVERYQAEEHSYDVIDSGKFDPMVIRGFIQSGLRSELDGFTEDLFRSLEPAVNSLMFRHYLVLCIRINAIIAVQSLGYNSGAFSQMLPTAGLDIRPEELKDYFSATLQAALRVRDDETQKQNSNIIENALSYIDQNFSDEAISLNAVAKAINISANYLSAVFSQKMGISFVEYLTQKRMEKAKTLLLRSSRRSGEIAYAVGYKDPRYFSFVFKKTQGCTPRDYRAGEKEKL